MPTAVIQRKCGHKEQWEYDGMALIHNLIANAPKNDCFDCRDKQQELFQGSSDEE